MKKLSLNAVHRVFLVLLFTIMQVALWAQENPSPSNPDNSGSSSSSTSTQTTTTTTTTWYMQPWAWILGGAILLLIIIALARSGSTDREVTRTTVVRDTEPRV